MYYLSSFLFSVISLTLVSCASIREKRQVTMSYVIDVYVVVDHAMYQKWKNWQIETTGETNATKLATETIATIKSYISLLFHQANLRLQTVNRTSPYSLSMQIVRMDIDVNIPNLNGSNNIAQALDIFTKWMNGSSVPYDHAVLMTSLEFKGENSAGEKLTYLGRAYVSMMCSLNYSLSVVVDNGAFQSSYHMTHEIGHSLGAQHDGTSTSANCSQRDSYLMVPVGISSDTSTDHPWYFSSCSVNNIKTYLETSIINVKPGTDVVNCFSETLEPIKEFLDEANVKAGQRYPPDQQCQMIYGKTSRACPDAGQGNLENICTTMGCVNPDNQTLCNIHFAAEWTSCGNGKRCSMGKCISDPEAPDIGDCYLGDSLDRIDGLSCSRAILDRPMRCYDTNVKTKCCKSCQQISAVNPSSCPYGDQAIGCSVDNCAGNMDKCCKTCRCRYVSDVSTIDGVSCAVRVNQDGVNHCYNATVSSLCCATCDVRRPSSTIANCEFGDLSRNGICSRSQCSVSSVKEQCCQTCVNVNSGHCHIPALPFYTLLFVISLLNAGVS